MNSKEKRCILFLAVYVIYVLSLIINGSYYAEFSQWKSLYGILRYSCYGGAIIKILWDFYEKEYRIKDVLLIVFIGLTAGACAWVTKDKSLAILWAFIVAGKHVSFRKIIWASLYAHIFAVSAVIAGSVAGIIENKLFVQGERNRYSLGFIYATYSSNYYYYMILMYVYCRQKKMSWLEAVILLVLDMILFRITDTKSATALGAAAIVCGMGLKYVDAEKIPQRLYKTVALACVPAFAAISIGLTITFDEENALFSKINSFLTGRLRLGNMAYEEQGITLLGQNIRWNTFELEGTVREAAVQSSVYVDSSYMQYLLNYGVIMLFLICALFVILSYRSWRNRDIYLSIIIVFFTAHAMFDPQLIWIAYNPFLWIYSYEVLEKSKSRERGAGIWT